MVDQKLLAIIKKEEYGVALTLLVNGVTFFGILMGEEQFFLESLRSYGRQIQNSTLVANREDLILEISRTMQDSHPYLHLSCVKAFVPGMPGPISLPALRISQEHISAWMFGLPGKDDVTERVIEDKLDDLQRDIP